MRRLLCLFLAMLLMLSGCMGQSPAKTEDGVLFYYRNADEKAYFSETGIMAAENRTIRWEQQSIAGLMEVYLQGPISPGLSSPFPKGLRLLETRILPGEITLIFDDSLSSLSAVGLRVAAGCIARTLWEYSGYETVILQAESQLLDGEEQLVLRPAEFVLSDNSAGQPNAPVRLYFADPQGRFLMEEQRSKPADIAMSQQEYILRSLITGPQSESLSPTIPRGTMLLSVSVQDGACLVDFSAEFRQNRPEQELQERMTIFSVVNSLTQLEEIETVEILVEGSPVERYLYLDLAQPLTEDSRLIGPVRSGMGEFDATLYVCLNGEEKLAAFPMRLQETVDAARVETVLKALSVFHASNGYYSPLAQYGKVQSVRTEEGSIHVEFAEGLMEQCKTEAERTALLRSIVATLSSLDEIDDIFLYEDGTDIPLTPELSRPTGDWFFP
ncbi:MAG: hypothetical protein E7464_07530 [Ruminococcaceae bacterium]|nr:hypothetical protein [Oscillospiraceae bacterium]